MASYRNTASYGRPFIVTSNIETIEAKLAERELSQYLQQSTISQSPKKSYPSYGNDLVSPKHW
jgi:hypothetical protein